MPSRLQTKRILVIATTLAFISSGGCSRNPVVDQAPQPIKTEASAAISIAEVAPVAPPEATPTDIDNIIRFPSGKTTLDDSDRQKLSVHAAHLKANPKLVLILQVHTASRGSRAYNLAITDKWTNSIIRMLNKYGVNRKQVRIEFVPQRNTSPKLSRSVELSYQH